MSGSMGKMTSRGVTRRHLLGAAAGAAAGAALAGCGLSRDGALGDGTGEIMVWTWPDNDRTFLETIPAFERKFPRIKVNVQGFSGAFGGSYNTKVLGALVS